MQTTAITPHISPNADITGGPTAITAPTEAPNAVDQVDLHRSTDITRNEDKLITAFEKFQASLSPNEEKTIRSIGEMHEIGLSSFAAMAKVAPEKFAAFIEEGLADLLPFVPKFAHQSTANTITSILKFVAQITGLKAINKSTPQLANQTTAASNLTDKSVAV